MSLFIFEDLLKTKKGAKTLYEFNIIPCKGFYKFLKSKFACKYKIMIHRNLKVQNVYSFIQFYMLETRYLACSSLLKIWYHTSQLQSSFEFCGILWPETAKLASSSSYVRSFVLFWPWNATNNLNPHIIKLVKCHKLSKWVYIKPFVNYYYYNLKFKLAIIAVLW